MYLIQTKRMVFFFFFILVLSNCTTVGFHDEAVRNKIDFGEEQALNVCVLHEESLSIEEVKELEQDWAEELALYKIKLNFAKTKKVERFAFAGIDVLVELGNYKLGSNCDRILYMIGRTWGDMAFEVISLGIFFGVGIKLEIHGMVETQTNTRGVVKSKYASLLQVLFTSPSSTLIHEGYHLLGCPHMLWKDKCYDIILEAKTNNKNNKNEDKIFSVKSNGRSGQEFHSYTEVDSYWGSRKEFKDKDN